jgi:putative DNA primase/helicase
VAYVEIENEVLGKHQIEFRFTTSHGKRTVTLDRADAAKPGRLADALLNAGYDLPFGPDQRVVLQWLTSTKPRRFIRVVRSTGWRSNCSVFVTPTSVIGKPRLPTRLADPKAPHLAKCKQGGTFAGWQTEVAGPAGALSSRFILMISAAFAAPLVPIMRQLSQGLHLYGDPGTAKTTAFIVAGSTYRISAEKDVIKLGSTEIGLEDLAVGHNAILMMLDELGVLEGGLKELAEQLRRLAYKLPSGSGKRKSQVYMRQHNLQHADWDTLFATSGEYALDELMARAGRKRSAGETSRFVDMPGVRKGSLGLIDYLPKEIDGPPEKWAADQIDTLKKACERHHGHAFPAFVEGVIAHRKVIKARIEELMAQFRRLAHIENVAGADKRRADLFALIYAAGELAVEWEIVPWTKKQVGRALRRCYRDACQPQSNALATEGLKILQERITSRSLIDLREHVPTTRKEVEAADGVIRV